MAWSFGDAADRKAAEDKAAMAAYEQRKAEAHEQMTAAQREIYTRRGLCECPVCRVGWHGNALNLRRKYNKLDAEILSLEHDNG